MNKENSNKNLKRGLIILAILFATISLIFINSAFQNLNSESSPITVVNASYQQTFYLGDVIYSPSVNSQHSNSEIYYFHGFTYVFNGGSFLIIGHAEPYKMSNIEVQINTGTHFQIRDRVFTIVSYNMYEGWISLKWD